MHLHVRLFNNGFFISLRDPQNVFQMIFLKIPHTCDLKFKPESKPTVNKGKNFTVK